MTFPQKWTGITFGTQTRNSTSQPASRSTARSFDPIHSHSERPATGDRACYSDWRCLKSTNSFRLRIFGRAEPGLVLVYNASRNTGCLERIFSGTQSCQKLASWWHVEPPGSTELLSRRGGVCPATGCNGSCPVLLLTTANSSNKTGWYPPLEAMSFVATFLTLYLLLSGYFVRIRALYNPSHKASTLMTLEDRLAWWAVKLLDPRLRHLSAPNFVDVRAETHSAIRLELLIRIMKASTKYRELASLISSSYRYENSFLSSMSGMAFSFSYAVSQVVAYRWIFGRGLNGNVSAIDFGQITPLFLLVLPVLAAAEIYYGNIPVTNREG